jgi:hypothetical protein
MEILKRPDASADSSGGPEMWIDEAIWGHRLHDEQSPWLTILEFLGVLHAEQGQNRALIEVTQNELSYKPQQQLRLRNLLFNNPHVVAVLASDQSDEAMWKAWLKLMTETADGFEGPNFEYLRQHFESFQDFASIVSFLQSSAIEGNSNKRWGSKFVFPFGTSALYEDAKIDGGATNDRRFFGRTGEVLYLMLCRSARSAELRQLLTERFLEAEAPYDGLAKALQGDTQKARNERGGAYVPCSSHPTFDRLAEDWISILRLPIPIYDAIPHIVAITGLNLVLYQLERGREALGGKDPITLICEIVSPKKSVVRDLSANSFQENDALPQRALEGYIRGVANGAEWKAAVASEEPGPNAAEVLSRKFDWPDLDDADECQGTPEALLDALVQKANVRHKQHVGKVHSTWARAIGLSSRRASRRVRYAPTDRLLKTLVVTCVDVRQEYQDFLSLLRDRYGLIIGEKEAGEIIKKGAADLEDFSDNAGRLEERLESLGLLNRLSDSCAYVENPFKRKARQ